MLITHAVGFAITSPIVYCLFVFRVVDFIIDDFLKKKTTIIRSQKLGREFRRIVLKFLLVIFFSRALV